MHSSVEFSLFILCCVNTLGNAIVNSSCILPKWDHLKEDTLSFASCFAQGQMICENGYHDKSFQSSDLNQGIQMVDHKGQFCGVAPAEDLKASY